MSMRTPVLGALALGLAIVLATIDAAGQGRGRGQAPGPPQTARQAAPSDLIGTCGWHLLRALSAVRKILLLLVRR